MDVIKAFWSRARTKVFAQIKLKGTTFVVNDWTADLFTVFKDYIWTLHLEKCDPKFFVFPIGISGPETVDEEEMLKILTEGWLPLGVTWKPEKDVVVFKTTPSPILIPNNDIRLQLLYGEIKGALSVNRETGDDVVNLVFMQRWSGFVSSLDWRIASLAL